MRRVDRRMYEAGVARAERATQTVSQLFLRRSRVRFVLRLNGAKLSWSKLSSIELSSIERGETCVYVCVRVETHKQASKQIVIIINVI